MLFFSFILNILSDMVITKCKGNKIEGSLPKAFRMHENYADFILKVDNKKFKPLKNKFKLLSCTRFKIKFLSIDLDDGIYNATLNAIVISAFMDVQPQMPLNSNCYLPRYFKQYDMKIDFIIRVENGNLFFIK